MSARTEFTSADLFTELAALQAEVKRLSGICETLIDAKLSQTETNADHRRRLAKLEAADMPKPKSQGYSRSGPAQDWRDGTQLSPKGENDATQTG